MIVTIERLKIDPDRVFGVVVGESDKLILIQRKYDFQFDGYMAVRKRDITKSYTSETSQYCAGLMKKEGLWKTPTKAARALPLADWQTLLCAMLGQPVIIENERTADFFIGPVIDGTASSVRICNFDACGRWQKIKRVPYRSITSVQFGSRCITVHSRHLPSRPAELLKGLT